MLFKKDYGELVRDALSYLETNTDITNTSIGGITRSLIEIINRNVADYYDILDINMAMGFLSTSEGYFLDLIGDLFNLDRIQASKASVASIDQTQRFYVTSGVLHDRIPADQIAAGTTVSTSDGLIKYTVTQDTSFSVSATEVYVPIQADDIGSGYNVPANIITTSNIGIGDVYTTNTKAIISGQDTESDINFKYRLSNATLSAEKANEISIRMAALSVEGVANVIVRKYARGIGTYDILVIPIEGIATSSLLSSVQTAIEAVQACGIKGTAVSPTMVPVDIEVKLVFTSNTTDSEKTTIRSNVVSAIEKYTVNITIGGVFILNELRQQIMDVSAKILDHKITCYYFREEPHFLGNVEIYWDEIFYPNTGSAEAIRVI